MLPQDTQSNTDATVDTKSAEGDSPEEAAQQIIKSDAERVRLLDGLASKVTKLFEERATQRLFKEIEWTQQQRLFNAPLQGSQDQLDKPFGESRGTLRRPEPNIVRTKCETAIANCVSLQFAASEKNWDLFPPANVKDQAVADACRGMEKEIETQLNESKYSMHSRRAIEDRVILGTGILKGPVNTGKLHVRYEQSNGTWVPKVTTNYAPKVEHVPLWRFYPDMSVSDTSEINDAIEIHPMTAIELSQYVDHPGFDGDVIKSILKGTEMDDAIHPDAYNETLAKISAEMWQRNPYLYKNRYVVFEYHGPVTYDDLNKLGLEPTYESPTNEYFGEVWVCCGKVIRMELENIEGYFEIPYSISPWKRDPASVFGFGHPLLLADAQRVVTQAYHMILDNASITSGPQVAMFQKYIQPVDGDWTLAPNKVWLLTDPTQQINNAIQFFNPTNVIANIMPVLDLAMRFADEESATTGLSAGLSSPENTETATGQLAMRHASTTLLDFMAEEWDEHVTEKIIRRMYAWNMQYSTNEAIKGDYCIDVKSSSEYKNKQMYIRDLERLSMEAAQNPEMAMVVNMEELQKARLALMHLPSNRIIKTEDEIKQAQQAAQQKPDPAQMEIQVKQSLAQTAAAKVKLDAQRLQFDARQAYQEALWAHQEKMGSNYARLQEAEASVIKARSETQVEMLKLAQKDDHFKAKLMNDTQLTDLNNQAQIFLSSMEEHRKQRELDQTDEELAIKKKQGTGI
jgi:hypothetical protein